MNHNLSMHHGDTVTLSLKDSATFTLAIEVAKSPELPMPTWRLPVDPVHQWTTRRGYRHTRTHSGYDINLDMSPWGNVEVGMPVYAITQSLVHYAIDEAPGWGAGGIVVLFSQWQGEPLYVRYAHVAPTVMAGDVVDAGNMIGQFVAHPKGSHLHFDMCRDTITKHWITSYPGYRWLDPAAVLNDVAGDFFNV